MIFDRMYVNGNVNPLGTGRKITLSWCYASDGKRDEVQKSFRILVSNENVQYDSGLIESSDMRFCLSDKMELRAETRYFWQVVASTGNETIESPLGTFETATDDLLTAKWITYGAVEVSSPVFYQHFMLKANVHSARAYVMGIGLIKCFCNDRSCSDAVLMPPNTPYEKQDYFETFDITDELNKGDNKFEIQLGNGYDMRYSKYGYRYDIPKGCRCLIKIAYENGETLSVTTDGTWLWRESQIIENGLYEGETFDARRRNLPSYGAVVNESEAPTGQPLPNEMPHVKVIARRYPVNSWQIENGTVYEFDSNVQGFTEIRVKAKKGTRITLDHCELIRPDGIPDPESNRNALAQDTYICSGEGIETYSPSFTYHGFRYVTVSGLENVEQFSICSLQISADVESRSSFECSDPTLNHIHQLCTHSIRCNLVSIPTDCPVRDERTPCLMDSQMVEAAAIHNWNMESYYLKWMRDITCREREIGSGNPDWAGDYIMLAYRLYRFYGNSDILQQIYPRMMKDLAVWINRREDGIIDTGFGDWCAPNDDTWEGYHGSVTATNTSLFYAHLCIAEEAAGLFGTTEEQRMCASWKNKLRKSVNESCISDSGSLWEGRQADLALPLYFGLIDESSQSKVMSAFNRKLAMDGNIDTGGYGTAALPAVSAASGCMDLLMKALRSGTYPGYGYWMATGSKSMWEQWASKGGMHSHSHALHGGIDAALYRVFCGITAKEPAYRKFGIAPCLPEDMNFCGCTLGTASGDIRIKIERLYGGLEMDIEIPPNTKATLTVPEYEKYRDCNMWDGERLIEKNECMELGSGHYQLRLVPISIYSGEFGTKN